MTWLAFGFGVCVGMLGWILMSAFMFRGLRDSQSQNHLDMVILHEFWAEANGLARERNDIAKGIIR